MLCGNWWYHASVCAAPVSVRAIGRNAVRDELARVAFNQFCLSNFDDVTFADLAGAAGVSRSTFLRYFVNKEDVVLFVFDPIGDIVVDALDSGQAQGDEWFKLRQALDPVVNFLERDIGEVIRFLQLIDRTPTLSTRFRQKQFDWRRGVVDKLRQCEAAPTGPSIISSVRVAAALECLSMALADWRDSDGQGDLTSLLDTAFGALTVPAASYPRALPDRSVPAI